MNKQFKVLVIGHPFNKTSGNGITMTNLFSGWPKSSLFIAADKLNIERNDFSLCSNTYRLGRSEVKIRFPFNMIFRQAPSGVVHNNDGLKNGDVKLSRKTKFYKLLERIYFKLGLNLLALRMHPSCKLIKWIESANPDVLYTLLGKYELLSLVEEIKYIIDIPLVVHIMDDWPKSLPRGFLKKYYSKQIDKKLIKVLSLSSINLAISKGMASEYENRYGSKFSYFHNPVDLSRWLSKKNVDIDNDVVKILYTGRIKVDHYNSLRDICLCVKSLSDKIQKKVIFDIYSNDSNTALAKELKNYSGVNLKSFIAHDQMPDLLIKYDLLLLPLDFSRHTINLANLSIPTKLSEYMISGVPIFVYAPEEMEIIRHSNEYLWGFNVTEKNFDVLLNGLSEAINNKKERQVKSRNAILYAQQNFDKKIVCKQFKEMLEKNRITHLIIFTQNN